MPFFYGLAEEPFLHIDHSLAYLYCRREKKVFANYDFDSLYFSDLNIIDMNYIKDGGIT